MYLLMYTVYVDELTWMFPYKCGRHERRHIAAEDFILIIRDGRIPPYASHPSCNPHNIPVACVQTRNLCHL